MQAENKSNYIQCQARFDVFENQCKQLCPMIKAFHQIVGSTKALLALRASIWGLGMNRYLLRITCSLPSLKLTIHAHLKSAIQSIKCKLLAFGYSLANLNWTGVRLSSSRKIICPSIKVLLSHKYFKILCLLIFFLLLKFMCILFIWYLQVCSTNMILLTFYALNVLKEKHSAPKIVN